MRLAGRTVWAARPLENRPAPACQIGRAIFNRSQIRHPLSKSSHYDTMRIGPDDYLRPRIADHPVRSPASYDRPALPASRGHAQGSEYSTDCAAGIPSHTVASDDRSRAWLRMGGYLLCVGAAGRTSWHALACASMPYDHAGTYRPVAPDSDSSQTHSLPPKQEQPEKRFSFMSFSIMANGTRIKACPLRLSASFHSSASSG